MDIPTTVSLLGCAGTAVTALGWVYTQKGRIDKHDLLFEEREKLFNVLMSNITDQLKRIEDKVDRMNTK